MAVTSPIINVMAKAAEKAARSLVRNFGEVSNLQVSKKGTAGFVSTADKKSEEILREELSIARPDFGFLLEEGGEVKGKGDTRWIVDPLDGTTNFLHGIPHWCISIAVQKAEAIIAGVVFDPLRDELFWAEKGGGAFVNSKRLRVSARDDLGEALFSIGTTLKEKGHISSFMKEFEAAAGVASGIRRMGSIALDLCYVAAGRFDAFWGYDLETWDIAAGSLLVSEAGGFVTDVKGGQGFINGDSLLATNAKLQVRMAKLLKGVNA